jgi:uncharacterized protein (TIGR02996 family)
MADMMAIVSKAVFEKAAGKAPSLGTRLAMDRYVSANKNLARLGEGGKLYLVTVRPPDEALWLVAILDNPKFDGEQWVSDPSQTPITDISSLRSQLVFESGKGIKAAKGALGMSLQTPRAVTAEDASLLDAAAGGDAAPPARPARAPSGKEGFPDAPEGAVSTGGGNRRELLLSAVLADPDSEAARQVYADALASANDPRGELILLDMQLDGPLSIRKREQMSQRKAALLAANAKKWWPYKIRWRTQRGFIAALTGSLKQINAVAPALFAAEPVTEVELTGIDGEDGVERLLAASWLSRVHKLVIRGKLGNEGFAALVAAPALANLRALNVTGNEIGAEGLAALRNHLPACRTLVLTNNPLGNGIDGLAKWAHVGELETLYLGKCDLSTANLELLLGGPALTRLAKLSLTENELGNGVAKLLAKHAAKLPALRHLELRSTGVGTAGVKELAQANLPSVRKIDVRLNRVDHKLATEDPRITA